jgi:hypothetical protein
MKNSKQQNDQLHFVKEHILIRNLGLRWEDYHPWSKNKYVYQPSQLFEHLVSVVIPLQQTKSIPTEPPLNFRKHHDELTLGTKSAGLVELDNSMLQQRQQIRINAMKEREFCYSNGFWDQLNEIQETSWPVERILRGGFKLTCAFFTKLMKETRCCSGAKE